MMMMMILTANDFKARYTILSPSRRHPKYHSVALLQEKTRRVPATLSFFLSFYLCVHDFLSYGSCLEGCLMRLSRHDH